MRFCPNRSILDNIFIIRKIFEKYYEHNICVDQHNRFVDYTQTFDSIYRIKIIEILAQYNFPAKLIRLMEVTLINTKTRVKINNEYTESLK